MEKLQQTVRLWFPPSAPSQYSTKNVDLCLTAIKKPQTNIFFRSKRDFCWLKGSHHTLARLNACRAIHQALGKSIAKCQVENAEKPNAHNFSSCYCCSTLHFIFQFCGPKKIKEENVKWQQTKWRRSRHSALPCAKKQAAKDEDRVKEEVDAA